MPPPAPALALVLLLLLVAAARSRDMRTCSLLLPVTKFIRAQSLVQPYDDPVLLMQVHLLRCCCCCCFRFPSTAAHHHPRRSPTAAAVPQRGRALQPPSSSSCPMTFTSITSCTPTTSRCFFPATNRSWTNCARRRCSQPHVPRRLNTPSRWLPLHASWLLPCVYYRMITGSCLRHRRENSIQV
jgi:hypothetical protein